VSNPSVRNRLDDTKPILVLALLSLTDPAFAQYSCEQVRAFVAANGLAAARAQARASGMTAEQEREANKCFSTRSASESFYYKQIVVLLQPNVE
jgi:hypothetical protein